MKRAVAAAFAAVAVLLAGLLFLRFRPDAQPPAALVVPAAEPTAAPATIPPTAAPVLPPTEPPAPTAAPPVPLTATLDPALDPDRLPLRGPVTVTFDRPVNAYTYARPLAFEPPLSGTFAWNEAGTAVTFTPTARFAAGKTYTLTVHEGLRGRDGATFAAPPVWTLTGADAPRVLRGPGVVAGDDVQPALALTFSRAMSPASVAAALSVAPEAALDLSWDDDHTLTIRPAAPLAPGQRYEFVLETGATDAEGVALLDRYRFGYTPAPILADAGPADDAPLLLTFARRMNPAGVVEALSVTPPVEGEWRWNATKDALTLWNGTPLVGGVEYAITFTAPLRAADGMTLPPPARPATYRAPAPVVGSPQGDKVHVATAVRLAFDRPMDHEATAAAFVLEPAKPGSLTWEGETLVFRPDDAFWRAETTYRVRLTTGARDAEGQPILGQPYVFSFTTGPAEVLATFGSGVHAQVIDADGRRAIQFSSTARQAAEVGFALYPLTADEFVARYLGAADNIRNASASHFPTAGLPAPVRWPAATEPGVDNRLNAQETFLPPEVGPGLYVLDLVAGPVNDQMLVGVTRLALAAKLAPREAVLWLTELPTRGANGPGEGAPLPGATVRLYAANGALVGEGQTGDNGLLRLPLDPGRPGPSLAVATLGDDATYLGFDHDWFSGGYFRWYGREDPPALFTGHVQTDRPLYRPGQRVHYKAIIRGEDDGRVSLPLERTQVLVRLRDSRANLVRERWLLTDAFGAVYDAFDLAEGAALGSYTVEALPVGPAGATETFRATFEVQEYRKPDFTVTVIPAAAGAVADEPLAVTVRADYLFGEPVAAADVTVRAYYYFGNDDYSYWESAGNNGVQAEMSGGAAELTLRDLGRQTVDWYFYETNRPRAWRLAIEATVDDGSAAPVAGFAVVDVYAAAEWVDLTLPGRVSRPDAPFPVSAAVRRTVGEPDAPVPGRDLTVQVRQWNETTYDYRDLVYNATWTTGPDGVATQDLVVPRAGYFRLTVSGVDEAGRPFRADEWFGAAFPGDEAAATRRAFRLTADRDSYNPGDTAQLLIESPFGGPALLAVERGGLRREMAVTLTPPATLVELPILDEDAPNVNAVLTVWEPLDTAPPPAEDDDWASMYSRPDARLAYTAIDLTVNPVNKRLTVTLTPERDSYAPRDTAAVTVRVTDETGAPVRAQVAVAVVDEAIFLLRRDNTRLLYDAFYFARPHRVGTFDALGPTRYIDSGGMGGGGDGDLMTASPRRDFRDTALWLPDLVTDENGVALVAVPLPDSLTTWRVTARAITAETQTGEATTTLRTRQDVQVRPILPGGLTAGDAVRLTAIVHNDGAAAAEFTVALSEPGGLLAVAAPQAQTLTLAAGETRVVGWEVTARAAGETTALVAVSSSNGDDAVELPLAIRPLAVPVVSWATGEAAGETTLALDAPAGALPQSAVTLEVGRSVAASLLNGLEYLTGFPYGCTEQVMSRALPNAVVGRAFQTLRAEPPANTNLPRLVDQSAQRLYALQHNDGGWGWWYDDDSSAYQTAWVVFGLATLAEAGYDVSPAVLDRGASYLEEILEQTGIHERAFVLYSLAAAGRPNGEAALILWEKQGDKLDAWSLAALALALDAAGESEAAAAALDELAARAVVDGERAHWTGVLRDGTYNRKLMASDVRATAFALSAFVRLRPGDPLEPQAVRWLMERRRGNGWGTTNETAFAILALTDHLAGTGLATEPLPFRVALNGVALAEGALAPGELRRVIPLPLERLRPGANEVVLSGGDRPLAYALNARFAVAQSEVAADGPVTITRAYLNPSGQQPMTEMMRGDLVKVQLTVQFPGDAAYVMVEDQLPGGLEALNERLNATGHDSAYYATSSRRAYTWRDYGYNYKEIRDGRVTFFITDLRAGRAVFTYLARATHSGTFTAMPAEASAMYDLEVWGRSDSATVAIGGAEE